MTEVLMWVSTQTKDGGSNMKTKEQRLAKAEAQLLRRITRAGKPLEKKKKEKKQRG